MQQSADLAAFMLQAGKFPAGAGRTGRRRAGADRVSDGERAGSGSAGGVPAPEGNLAELMRAIAFPNANIIFNLQLKDPAAARAKAAGHLAVRLRRVGLDRVSGMARRRSGRGGAHRDRGAAADARAPLPERQGRVPWIAPTGSSTWRRSPTSASSRTGRRRPETRRVRRRQREAERRVRELPQGVPRQGRRRGQRSRQVPVGVSECRPSGLP